MMLCIVLQHNVVYVFRRLFGRFFYSFIESAASFPCGDDVLYR